MKAAYAKKSSHIKTATDTHEIVALEKKNMCWHHRCLLTDPQSLIATQMILQPQINLHLLHSCYRILNTAVNLLIDNWQDLTQATVHPVW